MVYCVQIAFAKAAVLLQLQRIFAPIRTGGVYWSLIALQVFNPLFYFAGVVLLAFPCNPREKWWNTLIPGTCVNFQGMTLASASFNLCFDIAMLLVPLVAITRLQMSPARKAGVAAVFGVGIL